MDVIKARSANNGLDFFHFFKGRGGFLKIESKISQKIVINQKLGYKMNQKNKKTCKKIKN